MDLTTTYLGLALKNPIVPSASPMSRALDRIRRLEDAGAGAVVMYSLFEEQIEGESHLLDHYLRQGSDSFAEALSYFPDVNHYNAEPDAYLELVQRAKASCGIPIIGSLNGVTAGGWVDYAARIEQAGADALELNIYHIPTDPDTTGVQVEALYEQIVHEVRQRVRIPLAVKVGPYFSAIANMARRLVAAGASGLVLFNRFYQPDLDIEALEVAPNLILSDSNELRLPLRWTAILFERVKADLAITTGVHTHLDVLKGLMAGASVTMMASELLHHGPGRISEILAELTTWMDQHEYSSVRQMRGSMSQARVTLPDAYVRANYMKVLDSWGRMPRMQGGGSHFEDIAW